MIDLNATIPIKLTGSDLEKLVVEQCAKYEAARLASIGRYGVQSVNTGKEVIVLQSLPDFEGDIAPNGRHVIFDCKACSQASFDWSKYRAETKGARARQLKHMRKRSRYGALCFFLIHWNERALKAKTIPAQTYALRVDDADEYWDQVDGGFTKSLTLADCERMGVWVPWVVPERCRKPLPDFLNAVRWWGV